MTSVTHPTRRSPPSPRRTAAPDFGVEAWRDLLGPAERWTQAFGTSAAWAQLAAAAQELLPQIEATAAKVQAALAEHRKLDRTARRQPTTDERGV